MSTFATGGDPDVDSEAGFAAALASTVGKELPEGWTPSGESTRIEDGLTTEPESPAPSGQPRDPATGQFAPRVQETEIPAQQEAAPQATDEGEAEPTQHDPLAKQLSDAQAFIGTQGQQLGELRATNQALEARLAAHEQRAEALPQPQYSGPSVTPEQAEQLVDEGRGIEAALQARINGDFATYDLLIDTIAVDQPGLAARLHGDVLFHEANARAESAPAPAADPLLERARVREQASVVQAAITAENPADWDIIKQHFPQAVEMAGPAVANQLASLNEADVRAGVQLALHIARGLAAPAIAEAAKADAGNQAAMAAAKQLTALGAGSLRPAPTEEKSTSGQQLTREEAHKAFYSAILGAETTDIASGLTFGNAQ